MRTTNVRAWLAVLLSCGVCIAGIAIAGQRPAARAPMTLHVPDTGHPESFVVRGDLRVLRSCDAAGCSVWLDRGPAVDCYGQVHGEGSCFDVLLASVPEGHDARVTVHPEWRTRGKRVVLFPSAHEVLGSGAVAWALAALLLILYLIQLWRRAAASERCDRLAIARPATVTMDGEVVFEDDAAPTRGVTESFQRAGPVAAWVLCEGGATYRRTGKAVCRTSPGALDDLRRVARARRADAEALLGALHFAVFPTLGLYLLSTGHLNELWIGRSVGDIVVGVVALVVCTVERLGRRQSEARTT